VRVSWEQAAEFCKLLSEREGATYRLPTEAEWEYACRAGTTTRYSFGWDKKRLPEFAWCNYTNGRASAVGMLSPNPWGIYDMHGNVFEWVADWYSDTYYGECVERGISEDPQGPGKGRVHVLRGGGWEVDNPDALTCTARFPMPILDRIPFDPDPRTRDLGFRQTVGFRIVREPDVDKGAGQ
ncbi:MAG: formylglycine-generating enzyme family protein, partial [Planctomycetes bacterium]|nr:formylglycine-generating enzyme family protein [Planctomycetota bacterium]